jgi:hypothetical protein
MFPRISYIQVLFENPSFTGVLKQNLNQISVGKRQCVLMIPRLSGGSILKNRNLRLHFYTAIQLSESDDCGNGDRRLARLFQKKHLSH